MRRALVIVCATVLAGLPAGAQENPQQERGFDPEKLYQSGEIDHVDLAGAQVQVTIPIGPRYPVSERLSFGLTAVHTSRVWDFIGGTGATSRAVPNRLSNAGMSWRVTLGELYAPGHPLNPSNLRTDAWVYLSPDSGFHEFWSRLHDQDQEDSGDTQSVQRTLYSRDGSYLRLRRPTSGTTHRIDFPDGTTHLFEPSGVANEYRLVEIRDQFGTASAPENWVRVAYEAPDGQTRRWRITDSLRREHVVHLKLMSYDPQGGQPSRFMVDKIELSAFDDPADLSDGNGKATYDFAYLGEAGEPAADSLRRDCRNTDGSVSATLTAARLSRVYLPDNTLSLTDNPRWEFQYHNDVNAFSCQRGQLASIRYPTGGFVRYKYQRVLLPGEDDCPVYQAGLSEAVGIWQRIIDEDGTLVEPPNANADPRWYYGYELSDYSGTDLPCEPDPQSPVFWPTEEQKVTVTTPLLDRTEYFFSAWAGLNDSVPAGFRRREFGLPITRFETSSDGLFLSAKIYDCDASGSCLVNAHRKEYVQYENDNPAANPLYLPVATQLNRRVVARRTEYWDPTPVLPAPPVLLNFKKVVSSSFDGLGHYRLQTTSGDFPGQDVRESFTNYNPGRNYPGTTAPIPKTSAWILGTFGATEQREEQDGVAGYSSEEISRTEFYWAKDAAGYPSTGFLECARTLRLGTTQGTSDLLVAYEADARGNVSLEKYYGGDAHTVSTSTNCTVAGTVEYQIDHEHTYSDPAPNPATNPTRTSKYLGLSNSFFTSDVELDWRTGLPVTSRDPAGIPTTYKYDNRGRVKEIGPGNIAGVVDKEAWTEIKYLEASAPLAVESRRCVPDATSCTGSNRLTYDWVQFDPYGRPSMESRAMPGGDDFNWRQTFYDAMGHKTFVTSWYPLPAGDPFPSNPVGTQYEFYDAFGRPEVVGLPDGYQTDFTYLGDAWVGTTQSIGLELGGGDTDVLRWEGFDVHGRLVEVQELSNPADVEDLVATEYRYDEGNRLASVCHDRRPNGFCGQTRKFVYDNRGFLLSEQHPEKGDTANGDGTVNYGCYDSRGHAGRRDDGSSTRRVFFTFDAAERLTGVKSTSQSTCINPSGTLLKQFAYDTATGAGLGKLQKATRWNTTAAPISLSIRVDETYEYAGAGGRPSKRLTETFSGPFEVATEKWEVTAAYHPLGGYSTLGYPRCSGASCGPADPLTPARSVSFTYDDGLLSSIPGWMPASGPNTSITYHPSLLPETVPHGNGMLETLAIETLNRMPRPKRITVSSPTEATPWTTGDFHYDGAGNIKKLVVSTNPSVTDSFQYDRVSRLVDSRLESLSPVKKQKYDFDIFGSLTKITTTIGAGSPTIEPLPVKTPTTNHPINRLDAPATYDAAGNMTARGNGATYGFDRLNAMTDLCTNGQLGNCTGDRWSYIYTADDERLLAVLANSQRTIWTVRDFGGHVLARDERTASGILLNASDIHFVLSAGDATLIFGDGFESGNTLAWSNTSQGVAREVTDYIWRGDRLFAARDTEGDFRHFGLDHLGTVRVISDGVTGEFRSTHTYYPFGREATTPIAGADPMKFTGHERDAQTTATNTVDDLDYMRARYFSPTYERFASVDPQGPDLVFPQGWNRYSYVRGRSQILTDPTGRYVVLDNSSDSAAISAALEDPSLEGEISYEEVKTEVRLFGFTLWTRTEFHLSNGGADWSKSENPNARLIDSAIDSDTRIRFGLTDKVTGDLVDSNGAYTDTLRFDSENELRILINPALVAQARVPGPAGSLIGVELGWSIFHEFGHGLGHFVHKVYGGPGGRALGGNTDSYALDAENAARRWSAGQRGVQIPLRTGH